MTPLRLSKARLLLRIFGKFVIEHGLSFPGVGQINIEALMTLWQGKEYRLSETMSISVVLKMEGGCFLKALAATQLQPHTEINTSLKKKRKRIVASFGEEFQGLGENQPSNDSYCDAKKGESRKAETNDASIAVCEQEYIKEAPLCLEKAKDTFGKKSRHDSESPEIPGIEGPTKKKAKNDDSKKKVVRKDGDIVKKDGSFLEVTTKIGTVVLTEKKKKHRDRTKTNGPCSDLPSEVKHKPQIEDKNQRGGLDGWTGEEEIALRNAYFSARPSPHFWKKVSKMVPGKNAQECFNKIHSNFATPPSIPSKKRLNKGSQMYSPLKKFNLLELNSPKARKVSKQKKIRDARKTVRHLLKKQLSVDQVQDADYFSQFEDSPVNFPSDVQFHIDFSCKDRLNSDPEVKLKPGSSRNQPDPTPSPVVLKQVKNMKLHEKYLDHLHSVDARRKACVRAGGKKVKKKVDLGTQAGDLKDAKSALVSEAQDFIGCFKKLQADPFGDCALADEDDEDVF